MEDAVAALRHGHGDLPAALRTVADTARSGDGRSSLGELGAVAAVVSRARVRIHDDLFVLSSLRALRNLCAGEAINQDSFLAEQGIDLALSIASKLHGTLRGLDFDEEDGKLWLDSAKALFQMLGNVAGRGDEAQCSIWKAFFPETLLDLACVSTDEVLDPLSMVVYTCSRSSSDRRSELVRGKGSRLLAILLRDSPKSEWLSLLAETICLKDRHLPELFTNLAPSSSSSKSEFSSEQAVLLGLLYMVLDENQGAAGAMPWNSIELLADTIEQSAVVADSTKVLPWPTGLPSSDVLGWSLLLLRLVAAHEDVELDREGADDLIRTLLEMLRGLGPPEMVKRSAASKESPDPSREEHEQVASSRQFPKHNVYSGYRRDVVSVIANMSFHRVGIQDRVREDGGLLLVLQQCVVDDDNPYLREWGLWAIRNLTEANAKNVEELANLEMQKPVNVLEGYKVEVDEITKRPKLVNDSKRC